MSDDVVTDGFGQQYTVGDLVIFSTGGPGHGTRIQLAEVVKINPIVPGEYGSTRSPNALWEFPDGSRALYGSRWVDPLDPSKGRVSGKQIGKDVVVQTVAMTDWIRPGALPTKKAKARPKVSNILKWPGPDPRNGS